MEFIYYLLQEKSNIVLGVIRENRDCIEYYDLTIVPTLNTFNNVEENQLMPFTDSPLRVAIKTNLAVERLLNGDLEITKDYWVAFDHASGKKSKAITRNAIG